MKKIVVCKAQSTRREPNDVLGAELRIETEIPNTPDAAPGWEARAMAFYREQASLVDEALQQLPRGTRTALLVLLLESQKDVYNGRGP